MKNLTCVLYLLATLVTLGSSLVFAEPEEQSQHKDGVMHFSKGKAGLSAAVLPAATVRTSRHTHAAVVPAGVRRLVPQEYPTIQAGIDASFDGDTVLVSEGTYLENIRYDGKAITVASLYFVDDDTTHIEKTVIDGSQPSDPDSGSVVYFIDGEDTTSVLCGLTIRGGTGTRFDYAGLSYRYGGGVLLETAGGRLTRNNISHNRLIAASAFGGGISALCLTPNAPYLILEGNRVTDNFVQSVSSVGDNYGESGGADLTGVSARITGNVFERDTVKAGNFAGSGGLGLFQNPITGLFPTANIKDNVFRRNITISANSDAVGAGIFLYLATEVNVQKNLFENNIATSTSGSAIAGGIYIYQSSFRVENNIITGNSAKNYGGGLNIEGAPQQGTGQIIINNTFFDNDAQSSGGGLRVTDGANVVALNNIFWADTANAGREIYVNSATGTISYCNVQGGYAGNGNIDTDPMFIDDAFHLSDSSLCIGAGKDSLMLPGVDFFGLPRPDPAGSNPDLGAVENPLANSITTIWGGTALLPAKFALEQNYPNPFNPSTTIEFTLPKSEFAELKVYNILGKEVATLVLNELNQGNHTYQFNGKNLASGIYYYQLKAGDNREVKKMILIR